MFVIHDGSVLNSFNQLVPNAGEYQVEYLKAVRKGIDALSLPVERTVDDIAEPGPGGFGLVNQRTGLIVTPTAREMRHYRTVHFADATGLALNVGFVVLGSERTGGIGFLGIGAITEMQANQLGEMSQLIHEHAVLPAIHHVAGLVEHGGKAGGFFGT